MWSKYDFVTGDRIILEDDLSKEETGEFPSRWDLLNGNAEVARFGEQKVIYFAARNTAIIPLINDMSFLSEAFTIEFDLSFNKRSLKMYIGNKRVINIPNIKTENTPTRIVLQRGNPYKDLKNGVFIKNIRIAQGGKKLYDRLMADGKITSRGILFAPGEAIIKPQSMGTIKKITNLMKDHPEIAFRIEGHTDGDGSTDSNQELSEKRAAAVKAKLIAMGIDASRLKSKGWGESKPTDSNNTAEGKANNRRVEFVKI